MQWLKLLFIHSLKFYRVHHELRLNPDKRSKTIIFCFISNNPNVTFPVLAVVSVANIGLSLKSNNQIKLFVSKTLIHAVFFSLFFIIRVQCKIFKTRMQKKKHLKHLKYITEFHATFPGWKKTFPEVQKFFFSRVISNLFF